MNKTICDILMKLYLYADMTKMIHYSTDKNHAHELCDIIRDEITSFADNLGALCKSVTELVDWLRVKINEEPKLSNLVSLIDDFKGDMAKDVFLATFDNVSDYKIGG